MAQEPYPHIRDGDTPATAHAPPLSDCPECGLVAEVVTRFVVETGGGEPLECVAIHCIAGHRFRCPVECLHRAAGVVAAGRPPRRPREHAACREEATGTPEPAKE